MIGPTGPQGVQGTQGTQGDQGIPGPTGSQGIEGSQGNPGGEGPLGPTGPQGVQGPPGIGTVIPYSAGGFFTMNPGDAKDIYIGFGSTVDAKSSGTAGADALSFTVPKAGRIQDLNLAFKMYFLAPPQPFEITLNSVSLLRASGDTSIFPPPNPTPVFSLTDVIIVGTDQVQSILLNFTFSARPGNPFPVPVSANDRIAVEMNFANTGTAPWSFTISGHLEYTSP
jgi:hypothetical protein